MPSTFVRPLLLAAGALVLTGAASAQLKMAVINTQRAVLETAEMKKALADLETKYRPQQLDIEKRNKELEQIQEKLRNPKLTPQEAADLQTEGQRKQRAVQRLAEDVQGEFDRERAEILNKVGGRMQDVVNKLAEEKTLDLVLEASNAVYFKSILDVTQEAIAAYDKRYPLQK